MYEQLLRNSTNHEMTIIFILYMTPSHYYINVFSRNMPISCNTVLSSSRYLASKGNKGKRIPDGIWPISYKAHLVGMGLVSRNKALCNGISSELSLLAKD